jgi:uncharacterized protein YdiU (UPF0061 family)
MQAKLGLPEDEHHGPLVADLLELLGAQKVDFTSFFRALSSTLRGEDGGARGEFIDPEPFDAWSERWRAAQAGDPGSIAAAMDRVNPLYVPRNHKVEEALSAANAGDIEPFHSLVEVITEPYSEQPGREAYAGPAPESFGRYRTFCGT